MTPTIFENILEGLHAKGMAADHPEEIPPSNKSPIAVHCQEHQHRFIWDMKFIEKRMNDPFYHSYPTLCPTCISNIILEREANEICGRVSVELVDFSTDCKSYTYRLPCGHTQTSEKKHLQKMTHQPFCLICLQERRSKQDPLEYPLLQKFLNKVRRLRKQNKDFIEKIPEILGHIYKRLDDMDIVMHQIGFDEDENDVWVYMKCEGDDHCHRNTIALTDMLQRLRSVNIGSIKSVCHECCGLG